jgi:hypothetical protein
MEVNNNEKITVSAFKVCHDCLDLYLKKKTQKYTSEQNV